MAEDAGTLELIPTPAKVARDYALPRGFGIFDEKFYNNAQFKAKLGRIASRAQMPVLDDADHDSLKTALASHNLKLVEDIHPAGLLQPIQRQIYFDKCIDNTVKFGIDKTLDFLVSKHLYVSEDLHILDGHHRWLTAMMIGPTRPLPVYIVCEKSRAALRETLAYSDAMGKERNA